MSGCMRLGGAGCSEPADQIRKKRMVTTICPFCGAALQRRARFCPTCGRQLPAADQAPPVEGALPARHIRIQGDVLSLREVINVVESGMRWWQNRLTSGDITTREQAARS